MASRNYIDNIAKTITESDYRPRVKYLPTPTNSNQAFMVNTLDPDGGPDGLNDMFVVELKNGVVDTYCPSFSELGYPDVHGFNDLQHFFTWFEKMIMMGLGGMMDEDDSTGPHSALAATVGSNYLKRKQ